MPAALLDRLLLASPLGLACAALVLFCWLVRRADKLAGRVSSGRPDFDARRSGGKGGR